MIKAGTGDKHAIVELLTRSFDDNQSVNYLIRQDNKRTRRIRSLMEYSFELCSMFGQVWLSDDRTGCALVLYSQSKRTTFRSVWLDINLIIRCIGLRGIGKTLKREALIKAKQSKTDMAYLWFIGVDPVYQHTGTGSWLLQQVIVEAGKKSLPVYLETSTLINLSWYKRFGFQLYDELNLGYTLYFLKRDPVANPK